MVYPDKQMKNASKERQCSVVVAMDFLSVTVIAVGMSSTVRMFLRVSA